MTVQEPNWFPVSVTSMSGRKVIVQVHNKMTIQEMNNEISEVNNLGELLSTRKVRFKV